MRRLWVGLIAAAVFATATACGSVNPSPGPTVPPCWVGELVEYGLRLPSGEAAASEDTTFAADVIENRVIAYGPPEHRVESTADNTILVSLPRMIDSSDLRGVISATGNIEFVPVPAGEAVDAGDPRPRVNAIFGREGIADVQLSTNQVGQAAIDLGLTPVAAAALDNYAALHFGQQFAIVLDGTVISAPTIQAREFGGRVQVSGGFEANEPARLLTILRYPALPGQLDQISLDPVSPRTGCAP
jgi:preprotein translocase subunit SecD